MSARAMMNWRHMQLYFAIALCLIASSPSCYALFVRAADEHETSESTGSSSSSDGDEGGDSGLSTEKKFIIGVAIGVGVPALASLIWAFARRKREPE